MREQEHPFQHRFIRFDMRWLSIHGVGIVGLGRAVRHSLGLTPTYAGLRGVRAPFRLLRGPKQGDPEP